MFSWPTRGQVVRFQSLVRLHRRQVDHLVLDLLAQVGEERLGFSIWAYRCGSHFAQCFIAIVPYRFIVLLLFVTPDELQGHLPFDVTSASPAHPPASPSLVSAHDGTTR